jgi:tape measure domain-containing protein
MAKAAKRAYEELRQLQDAVSALRSQGVTLKVDNQSFQQAKTAVEQTEAATRKLGSTEKALAQDRARAIKEAARLDADRLKQIQSLESAVARERARAAQVQSRLDAERLRAAEREAQVRARALAQEEAARVRLLSRDQRNSISQQSRQDAERLRQLQREERAARQAASREERSAAREVARQREQALREERRIVGQIAADRLRAARELSRADGQRLAEMQRIERQLASLRSRTATPQQRAQLEFRDNSSILNRAQAAGLLNARQTLALRQQIAAHYQREAQGANGLKASIAALADSFGTLSRTTALAIPGLLTIQETLFSISGAVGGGGVGTAGKVGLIAGVGALAAAFAGFSAVQNIAQASIEFEKIRGALRAATGDTEKAEAEFQFLSAVANRLGTDLKFSAGEYAKLAAAARSANYDMSTARSVFLGVAQASAALRLGADETAGVLYALQQVISQNTLKSEELKRQLGDRLPGAFAIAAAALKKTPEELTEAMEKGLVSASEFIPAFAKALQDLFGAEALQASEELLGQLNRLRNEIFLLEVEAGKAGIVDALVDGVEQLRSALANEETRQGLLNIANLLGGTLKFMVENSTQILTVLGAIAGAGAGLTVGGPIGAVLGAIAGAGGVQVGLALNAPEKSEFEKAAANVRILENAYRDLSEAGAQADANNLGESLKQQREIAIKLDPEGLKQARLVLAELEETYATTSLTPFAEQQLIGDIERQRAKVLELQGVVKETTTTTDAYAAAVASAATVVEDEATKTERARKAFSEFESDLDKVKKAHEEYNATVLELDRGLKEGYITQARYNELLVIAKEEMDRASGASKELAKTEREAEKAAAQAAKERGQATIELIGYIGALNQSVVEAQQDVNAARQGEAAVTALARARAIDNALVEARAKALERKQPLEAEEVRIIEEKAGKLFDLQQELTKVKKAQKDAEAETERRREAERDLLLEPFKEAARSVQGLFADTFEKVFDGGIDSFKDLAGEVFSIFKRLAAEIASLLIFRPILQSFSGTAGLTSILGGGNAGGGILSALFGAGSSAAIGTGGTFGNVSGGASSTAPSPSFFQNILSLGSKLVNGLSGLTSVGTFGGYGAGLALRGLNGLGITLSGAQQLGVISAFSPLAGIGGALGAFGAQALGLGSGNGLIDGGLGLVGGIGGGIAGGALMGASLGTFAGPIGAAIGAFLGVAAGSLIPKNRPDHQEFQIYSGGVGTPANIFEDGAFSEGPFGRVGILGTKGTQVGQDFSQQLANFLGASDAAIAKSLTDAEIERVRAAIEGTLGPKVNTRGKSFSENDIAVVVQSRLAQQFAALGLGEQLVSIERQAAAANNNTPNAAYLEALTGGAASFLEERKSFIEALEELEAGPLGEAEAALKELDDRFKELSEAAKVYGEEQSRIDAARAQSLQRLKDEFTDNTEVEILKIENPLQSQLNELDKAREEQIKNAQALGLEITRIEYLFGLQRAQIVTNFQKTISDRILELEDPLAASLKALDEWRDEQIKNATTLGLSTVEIEKLYGLERLRIIEEYNQSGVNSFKAARDSIKDLIKELTQGSSSPLSAQTVFDNAFTELMKLNLDAQTAATPELRAEALTQISEAATNLLNAAENLYASGPQFFAVFNQVLALLQARSTAQDVSEPQLPAFATGGSFVIPGNTGPDTRVVKFKASGGERVSISRQSDQMAMLRGLKDVGQEITRGNSDSTATMDKLIHEIRLLRRELATK